MTFAVRTSHRAFPRLAVAFIILFCAALTASAAFAAMPSNAPKPAAVSAPSAPETHDRLGQLIWQKTGPTTAQLEATAGIRRSFYNPPPNVGDTIPFASINFGDGSAPSNTSFIVTYVDSVHDWIIAEKEVTHTYA